MPYCTQCGRYLFDGETCSCSSSDKSGLNAAPPPQNNYQGGIQQTQYNGGGYPYPQGYYGYGQYYPQYGEPPYAQQKKKRGWIIGLVTGIVLLVVMGAAMVFFPFLELVHDSKRSSMMSRANTLRMACNTAMIEMEEEGTELRGVYIISSDEKDNVAVPFDTDRFYKALKNYYDRSDQYKYFIVVRYGNVEYAALAENWTEKTDMIGTWPSGSNPRYYDKNSSTGKEVKKKVNLDDLYWHAYDELFS